MCMLQLLGRSDSMRLPLFQMYLCFFYLFFLEELFVTPHFQSQHSSSSGCLGWEEECLLQVFVEGVLF